MDEVVMKIRTRIKSLTSWEKENQKHLAENERSQHLSEATESEIHAEIRCVLAEIDFLKGILRSVGAL